MRDKEWLVASSFLLVPWPCLRRPLAGEAASTAGVAAARQPSAPALCLHGRLAAMKK